MLMETKPYLYDRQITQHPEGFCVITPNDIDPSVPLSCSVCSYLMRTQDDEIAWREFSCCHKCSLSWAASRREAWAEGWRPDAQKLAEEIALRPHLVVNLIVELRTLYLDKE